MRVCIVYDLYRHPRSHRQASARATPANSLYIACLSSLTGFRAPSDRTSSHTHVAVAVAVRAVRFLSVAGGRTHVHARTAGRAHQRVRGADGESRREAPGSRRRRPSQASYQKGRRPRGARVKSPATRGSARIFRARYPRGRADEFVCSS